MFFIPPIVESYKETNTEGMLQFDIHHVDVSRRIVYGTNIRIWVNKKYDFRKANIVKHELRHLEHCLFHNTYFDDRIKLGQSDWYLKCLIEVFAKVKIDYNERWILQPYEDIPPKH